MRQSRFAGEGIKMVALSRKNGFWALCTVMILIMSVHGAGASSPLFKQSAAVERVEKVADVIMALMDNPDAEIPESLLRKAAAIAVFPGVIKAAYGIGGQYGEGIVMVRQGGVRWSDPFFVTLVGGSVGWQIGVQKADIVLVFMGRSSIRDISEGKITLGADVSVTAGPVGRRAGVSTDLELEEEIYSYSQSKGLFAGVSLSGASIRIDRDANSAFYGESGITVDEILESDRSDETEAVRKLKAILAELITISI